MQLCIQRCGITHYSVSEFKYLVTSIFHGYFSVSYSWSGKSLCWFCMVQLSLREQNIKDIQDKPDKQKERVPQRGYMRTRVPSHVQNNLEKGGWKGVSVFIFKIYLGVSWKSGFLCGVFILCKMFNLKVVHATFW